MTSLKQRLNEINSCKHKFKYTSYEGIPFRYCKECMMLDGLIEYKDERGWTTRSPLIMKDDTSTTNNAHLPDK